MKKAFADKATKAEDITDDFEASVDSVDLDEVDVLHLLDITSWSPNCLEHFKILKFKKTFVL
ncbi:34546_t:CDS:1, partial [Racocetra persica]